MSRIVVPLLLLLSLAACARHHVIARTEGRLDPATSTASTSDLEWTIQKEPDSDRER